MMKKKKKCTLCTRASSRDYYNDNASAASVSGIERTHIERYT